MDNTLVRILVIFVLVTITGFIVNYLRNKIYKPKYEKNVQKPGKLSGFILKLFIFLTAFLFLFAVIGLAMKEIEMATVFGCLALFFGFIIAILKWSLQMSYQENDEYFILKVRKKSYQVFYENIVDWKPSYNEIAVFDETNPGAGYIRINIKIFKPEILLRKIADMAFDGKFRNLEQQDQDDPNREKQTINYLVVYNYGYLVEDYIEKLENE